MACWIEVVPIKAWNPTASSSSCFNHSNEFHGGYFKGKISDRVLIHSPSDRRALTTSKCRAIKPAVTASDQTFAPLIKRQCVYDRVQEQQKSTPCILRTQRLNVSAKYLFPSFLAASSTTTIETFKPEVIIRKELPTVPKLWEKWRNIQGADDWKTLLDPLDPDLKAEIIKYGEFAQLCYDAFDCDSHSDYCGSCRFNPKKLLKEYGLREKDYEITKYLYATSPVSIPKIFKTSDSKSPWSRNSNWIGFVAISSSKREIKRLGRRDIVVAWRGTVTRLDWLTDLQNSLSPASGLYDQGGVARSMQHAGDVGIETGFLRLYTTKDPACAAMHTSEHSAREQLLSEIERLRELYRGEELSISLTGHGLGAALALLSAYDIAESGLNTKMLGNGRYNHAPACSPSVNPTTKSSSRQSLENIFQQQEEAITHHEAAGEVLDKIPITVFSFGGPRVGNSAFRDRVDDLGVKVLRVVNEKDMVPRVPGLILNEKLHFIHEWFPFTYTHVGVEFVINSHDSPYLASSLDPSCLHNLEAHMHLIDGYTSSRNKFSDEVLSRDPALVNKNSDFLKRHLKIPSFWRQDKDKGLIKHADGKFNLRGRETEDIPLYH